MLLLLLLLPTYLLLHFFTFLLLNYLIEELHHQNIYFVGKHQILVIFCKLTVYPNYTKPIWTTYWELIVLVRNGLLFEVKGNFKVQKFRTFLCVIDINFVTLHSGICNFTNYKVKWSLLEECTSHSVTLHGLLYNVTKLISNEKTYGFPYLIIIIEGK